MSTSSNPLGIMAGGAAAGGADWSCDVTVALYSNKSITFYGYDSLLVAGSLSDTTEYNGYTVYSVRHNTVPSASFTFQIQSPSLGASYFTSLEIDDASTTTQLDTADATYSTNGTTYSNWVWTTTYWTGTWILEQGNTHEIRQYM